MHKFFAVLVKSPEGNIKFLAGSQIYKVFSGVSDVPTLFITEQDAKLVAEQFISSEQKVNAQASQVKITEIFINTFSF